MCKFDFVFSWLGIQYDSIVWVIMRRRWVSSQRSHSSCSSSILILKDYCKMVVTPLLMHLTHWGWVAHKCISKLTILGSDNGFLPGQCQAIIWNNDGILSIGPLGINFSEILIRIQTFSFIKMHLKRKAVYGMASILSPPQCVKLPECCTKPSLDESHKCGRS